MPEQPKEQFTKEEPIVVEQTAPLAPPAGIVTTERKRIRRGVPLKENHQMTTEANRFKET
jgi:hypothetical protein